MPLFSPCSSVVAPSVFCVSTCFEHFLKLYLFLLLLHRFPSCTLVPTLHFFLSRHFFYSTALIGSSARAPPGRSLAGVAGAGRALRAGDPAYRVPLAAYRAGSPAYRGPLSALCGHPPEGGEPPTRQTCGCLHHVGRKNGEHVHAGNPAYREPLAA